MKRYRFCALLIVWLVLTGTASAVCAQGRWLEAEQTTFAFEPLLEGQSVSHTFRFVNRGHEPLVISRVRSSCGCTAAILSSRRIDPGEQGQLKVTFDSRGFRGQVTKTVAVYTNDPVQPKTLFTISGKVKPLLSVDPERVLLHGLTTGKEKQVEVMLTNHGADPIRLTSVRSTSETITVSAQAMMLEPGGSVPLMISASLPEQATRLSGYVLLETDNPVVASKRLVVRGYAE